MQLKIIKTEAEHATALAALTTLLEREPSPGTADADHLELLSLLIDDYEKKHFPIEIPDPVDAIKFRMEQQGLTEADLIPYFNSAETVAEVLNRRQPLDLPMIRALHTGLGIPAAILIHEQAMEHLSVRQAA